MKLFGVTVPKGVENLCQPALLYLFLTIISSTFYLFSMMRLNNQVRINGSDVTIHDYTFMGFILKLLISVFWIYFLNHLCKHKMGKKIAWAIVLLPFFFMGLIFIGVMCAFSYILLSQSDVGTLKTKVDDHDKKFGEYKQQYKGNLQDGVGINTRVVNPKVVQEGPLKSKVTGELQGYSF